MGREIHRVPLDFDWPLNQPWKGYLLDDNLHGERCPECDGTGQTYAGWWVQKMSYLFGMLADDYRSQQAGRPMHPWLTEFPSAPGRWVDQRYEVYRPSADIIAMFSALTGHPEDKIGQLSILDSNKRMDYVLFHKIEEITGISFDCKNCDGHGTTEKYPGQRAEAEAWERSDPPEGPGYQMWETVSEGSPISPVFAAPAELAVWMVKNGQAGSFEVAMKFIDTGWAPSFVISGSTLKSGVDFVGEQD